MPEYCFGCGVKRGQGHEEGCMERNEFIVTED